MFLKLVFLLAPILCCASQGALGAQISAVETGAPAVAVTHANGKWTIAGKKNVVMLNESDLAIDIHAGPASWKMVPSSAHEMRIAANGDEFYTRLADAQRIDISPYTTGFKTGVRIILEGFRNTGVLARGSLLNTRVVLTMCLEGIDEDLVFEAMVNENGAAVKELNWPKAWTAARWTTRSFQAITARFCRVIGPSRIIPFNAPRAITASFKAISSSRGPCPGGVSRRAIRP
ncbi:MAG TPA: hypothetical protein VG168_06765 [Bryobacteraceae bacterium]|jgi:hypothetical protein|nr:hypothetical protein [Bryobacteraceae bacterium]